MVAMGLSDLCLLANQSVDKQSTSLMWKSDMFIGL